MLIASAWRRRTSPSPSNEKGRSPWRTGHIGPNAIQIHPEGGNRRELKVLTPKKLESGDPLFRFRTFPDPDAKVNVRTKVPMRIGFGTPPADIDFINTSIIAGVFEIVKGLRRPRRRKLTRATRVPAQPRPTPL